MKEFAMKAFGAIWTAFFAILFAPFLIPAFCIVKLMGGDPFSMDGMGADWLFMVMIAIGIAVASGFFILGLLL